MKFTEKVPEYNIDLDLPPDQRWSEVIESERHTILTLCEGYREFIPEEQCWKVKLVNIMYRSMFGKYLDEVLFLRDDLREPLLPIMNISYDLSSHSFVRDGLGCSAGFVQGKNPIHIRTLDWDVRGMGKATRIFNFWKGDRMFVTAGVPGFAGVLSGMLPGAYSVCINWLPSSSVIPSPFSISPVFLIRLVLEEADTFEEAVDLLQRHIMASSAGFTVCGAKRGQFCVIERSELEDSTRTSSTTQTNHFIGKELNYLNDNLHHETEGYMSLYEDSVERRKELTKSLSKFKGDIGDSIEKLNCVLKGDTQQKIAFCPGTGEYIVMRRSK